MPFEPPSLPPRCTRRRLACLGALATLLVVRSATAQKEAAAPQDKIAAQALFERALVDMQAARFKQACPAFAESLRLYYSPGTLFTLAECEAKRGHIVAALSRYSEYLALYEILLPEKKAAQGSRPKESQAQMAALGPVVPKLVLVLPKTAPKETQVKLDGQQVPRDKLGTAMLVDPGEHMFSTEVPGGPVTQRLVTLVKGDERKFELEVKPSAAPPSAAPSTNIDAPTLPSDVAPGGSHAGAYIVGSVGIASLLLGCVAGGFVLANNNVIDANCTDGAEGVKICRTIEGVEAGRQSKALSLVSMIGFGAGLIGIGGAAIFLLTEPPPPQQAPQTSRSAPTQVAKPRWWVNAGPLSDPRGGAMLRFQGVW